MNNLAHIWWKPQYKEIITNSRGRRGTFRPFVGFILFFLGKLIAAIPALVLYNNKVSDLSRKPFTVYFLAAYYFLSSLGLHIYLTLQEFIFYAINNYHGKFVHYLMKTQTGEKHRSSKSENDQEDPVDLQNTATGMVFDEAVVDLCEMMKSMIEMIGPSLLQNLALMLLYWLLHVYDVVFLAYLSWQLFRGTNQTPDVASQTNVLLVLALTGSALIVR